MDNEYYGIASTPMDDYLAHYGIRGMKWGVRKAIKSGNSARLSRQYDRAQKKLAKLEKAAANSKKYAKRAVRMGIGAAAAGGLAAAGTEGVSRGISKAGGVIAGASKGIGNALQKASHQKIIPMSAKQRAKMRAVGGSMVQAGKVKLGEHGVIAGTAANASKAVRDWGNATNALGKNSAIMLRKGNKAWGVKNPLAGVSNNTIARIGAGAIGAGLAAGAARNAYKAATAKKKAEKFRSEMNKAFAGTKYANGRPASTSKKRRGSRRG